MIRRFLYNFFRGRNGFDRLCLCTWALTFVFLLLSFIPGWVGLIMQALSFVFLFITLFRAISRNIPRRSAENAKYLELTAGLRRKLRNMKTRFSQRKEYKFFTCPTCHTLLRVPRGKGRIQITCSKCGNRFSGKT